MTSLTHPPALRPGDGVYVCSPAGPVTPEILKPGIELLEQWGLDVVVDEAIYQRRPPYGYLAGDDQMRHRALMRAWRHPGCRAIICSRGGYGAMRLLPMLDLDELVDNPKLFVGFSDITALHLYLAGIGGLATLHGPVVKSLRMHTGDDPHQSGQRLKEALFATTDPPRFTGMRTVRGGTASGPVYGGNLSLVVPLLASPYRPSFDGAILVLEDVDEQDYRIDRLLTALRLADDADLGGLVLGEFSDLPDAFVSPDQVDDFLQMLGAEFDCPVVAGAPVGHESRNHAFPVGVQAELDADAGTLTFESHAATPHDAH